MNVRHDMISCFVARPTASQKNEYEFLQLRREKNDFMGGTWQAVTGRAEDGETAWQAALRELHEEAGLVPREFFVIEFVNSFYIPSQDTLWHCTNFLAIVDAGAEVRLNEEHDAVRWIAKDELDAHFMWPGERAALAEACREILDNGPAKEYLRIKMKTV